jgi:A/G-specific adenine glycosylase
MGKSKSALRLRPASLRKLRNALLGWYDQNKRNLPWRHDADPYSIWVSEIMLQQTRVAAVVDHYSRFMQRFPTVQILAAAREASVLAAWSGLGYYHRARRMHQAAKVIVRQRHGEFPRTAEEWRELPGIGRYTAAAIASIAFGEAVAAVDGNVERVIARMFGRTEGREAAWHRAETLLDQRRPGDFNQAMMELGATVCTPRAPECALCPLNFWCKSRGADSARTQAARRHKQLYYALVRKGRDVLLAQRPANASLMAAMWELPAILESQRNGNELVVRLRHSITDTDYDVSVISVTPDRLQKPKGDDSRWFSRRQWERLPLTGLTRKVLHRSWGESSGRDAESNQRL